MIKTKLKVLIMLFLVVGSALVIFNMSQEPSTDLLITYRNFDVINTQVLEDLGITIDHQYVYQPTLSVSVPNSLIPTLQKMESIINVQENEVYSVEAVPNDPGYSQLWGMDKIQAPTAWDVRSDASSVVVAIIDTGVQLSHPDLAGNKWTNPGEIAGNGVDDDGNGYVDDINGWDFQNNDNSYYDSTSDSHGTHVAGTIGAVGNNNLGVIGVAPNVQLMALKFIGSAGGSTADAISAIEYATAMGADIISASWGGGGYDAALKTAIDNFPGLFVAAAGNDGVDNDATPHYPSSYTSSNLIAVASSTSTDGASSFSNWGATSVDIAAPGSSIYSTWPSNTYNTISGTSMATPHVSGAAALVLAEYPSLTPQQLKARLVDYSDPISAFSSSSSRPVSSGGRLNVYKSLTGGGSPPADTTAPSQVTGLTASAASSSQIDLTWNAATDNVGVTGYKVYRGGTLLGTSTTTSYADTGLTASTTYSYTVSAVDAAANEGAQSASVSATTSSGTTPPPSGTVTDTFTGTANKVFYFDVGSAGTIDALLSWSSSADIDMYLYAPGMNTGSSSVYSARAYTTQNPESISFSATTTGQWAIRVNFYSGASTTYTLDVTHPSGSGTTPPPSGTVTDTFTGTANQVFYFDVGSAGTIDAVLSWSSSADIDMYLYAPGMNTGSSSVYSARAYTLSNPETISFSATTTGQWAIRVNFYSGASTTYTLTVTHPAP